MPVYQRSWCIYSIEGEVYIQLKLRILYPSRPHDCPLWICWKLAVNPWTILLWHAITWSITGHSNDHYKDILRARPEAFTSIMSLCNLIAIGTLPDGPARKLLLSGKGTALHKSPSGLRPVVTLVPCGQYTSHAIECMRRSLRSMVDGRFFVCQKWCMRSFGESTYDKSILSYLRRYKSDH